MSGLLAGKVWQSALSPHLKPLAAALADIGNDDGTSIYPSVAYVSWLLGRSERSVQYGLDELRSVGVLVVEKNGRGGRFATTEYRMVEEKLPVRQAWRESRKGATVSPIPTGNGATPAPIAEQKGATDDTKGCNLRHERVKLVAPEPSLTVLTKENSKTTTAPNPKKRATPFLDGFELDAEMMSFANDCGIDPQAEFEKFRDHSKANGKMFSDWKAAWRNWVRNAKKWQVEKGGSNGNGYRAPRGAISNSGRQSGRQPDHDASDGL